MRAHRPPRRQSGAKMKSRHNFPYSARSRRPEYASASSPRRVSRVCACDVSCSSAGRPRLPGRISPAFICHRPTVRPRSHQRPPTASKATAPQVAAQSPSDSSNTKISASPLLSRKAAWHSDRGGWRWFFPNAPEIGGVSALRRDIPVHPLLSNQPEKPSASLRYFLRRNHLSAGLIYLGTQSPIRHS
jgi:hypothetical protein